MPNIGVAGSSLGIASLSPAYTADMQPYVSVRTALRALDAEPH